MRITHAYVARRSRQWARWYADAPKLIKARTPKDAERVGIHLLNPTLAEISEAHERAARDLFPAIYVHTRRTFAGGAP